MMIIVYITFSILLFSLLVYYVIPWVYGRYARVILKHKAIKRNSIVLTFDDGPGSRLTPTILDILAKYNIKATFFILGRNISGREEIVRQIAEHGHEICSHGYDHLDYWKVSPFRAVADIKRGYRAIDGVLGTKGGCYPFRPPYGRLNFISLLYLWIRKVPIVFWTFDLGDTWPSEKKDLHSISVIEKESGGIVMLAHDFDRTSEDTNDMVLKSIRSILARTNERNMPALTVSQFLESCF